MTISLSPSPSQEQEFFRERGFGLRIGFGTRPALLVIDMINSFTDPSMMLGADLAGPIKATRQMLQVARENGVPVIFTTVSYSEPGQKDAGIWALKQKGVATLIAGSHGVQIDERLQFGPGDSLLVKKYASCFFGTDLVARLVSQGIDTLIVAGCTTSGCVRATVVDACQTGFRPMIVREAVGDRSEAAHIQSLFDMDAKYGDIVTLDDTLGYLRQLPFER